MKPVIISQAANEDHRDITDYIAKDNQGAALRFGDELFAAGRARGWLPSAGNRRTDVTENLYTFPYGQHVIIYSIEPDHVLIRRIVHGARRIDRILAEAAKR